jgi:hypothetical protein
LLGKDKIFALVSAGNLFSDSASPSPMVGEARKGYRLLISSLHTAQFFVDNRLADLFEGLGIDVEKQQWPLNLSLESSLIVFLLVANPGPGNSSLTAHGVWTTVLKALSGSLGETSASTEVISAAHKNLLLILFHLLCGSEKEAILAELDQGLSKAVGHFTGKKPTLSQLANCAFLIRLVSCKLSIVLSSFSSFLSPFTFSSSRCDQVLLDDALRSRACR